MQSEKEEERVETFRYVVTGCTGSGKTHFVKWLLRTLPEGSIDELYVYTASGSPEEWPETTPSRVITEWDGTRVRRQMRHQGHKVFIVDDFLGLIKREDPTLIHLFTAGRHANSSAILITQRLNGFSTAIRVNASRICICRTMAAKELDSLHDEAATAAHRKKADWYEFVEKNTRNRQVLIAEMAAPNAEEQFTVVKPAAELPDMFVEPTNETDSEDEGAVGGTKHAAMVKKPLPASNRRWKPAFGEITKKGRRPASRSRNEPVV